METRIISREEFMELLSELQPSLSKKAVEACFEFEYWKDRRIIKVVCAPAEPDDTSIQSG